MRPATDVARERNREAGRNVTVSHLARSIRESATLALNERAKQLADRGQPVIHLGGGEPKNKAPLSAIVSASAQLTRGDVKYAPTDGTPALKQAIIRYTEEHYGRVVAPENVIVSSGAKQSIYNALLAIVDPQDEVVILSPYWVSYPEMVRMVHGQPVIVTPEDGGFVPRLDEVESALGPYTKAVIVNSPNNPTGRGLPAGADRGARCALRGAGSARAHGRHLPPARLRRRPRRIGLRVHRPRRRRVDADRRQRRLEAVRDDGLPHRLDGRAARRWSRC